MKDNILYILYELKTQLSFFNNNFKENLFVANLSC